jgi:hypothetical protein
MAMWISRIIGLILALLGAGLLALGGRMFRLASAHAQQLMVQFSGLAGAGGILLIVAAVLILLTVGRRQAHR